MNVFTIVAIAKISPKWNILYDLLCYFILLYVYTFCLIYLFILVSYLSVYGGNICFLCLVIQISCILEISPRFSIALLNVESLDLKSNILYDFFCDFVLLYVLLQCMSILVVVIKKKQKNFVPPMYDTRFSCQKVATPKVAIEKAAKSESNEGRCFRNFTVFF